MNKSKIKAFITGIGWVSKESMGHITHKQNHNQNHIQNHSQQFDRATKLPRIKRKDILNHPYKPFGRMDDFSKLGFAAIAFAMEDAGIKKDGEKKDGEKKNISLIASTVTGCLKTDINFQKTLSESLPSPTIFAYTLASSFLGEAAIYFGLTGESFVINEERTNGLKGLLMAIEIIESGESDIVLCGVCNSDIKTINSSSNIIKPGSLFFVIEKKSLHSYGAIKSISLENIYYQNDIKITGLYDLAEKCSNRKI